MSEDNRKFVIRVKGKTKMLKRALVRELGENVLLRQCREWISIEYGFQSYDDLLRHYPSRGFAFDEFISEAELRNRLSAQAQSLAFDFDLDDEVARRIVYEIRPTSARSKNSEAPRTGSSGSLA